jgi:hypothetical protein
MFGANVVGSNVCWGVAAAGGFLFASSGNPVVNAHEVSLLHELSYEVTNAVSLGSSPYPIDGHEALLRGLMILSGDFVQGSVEVADWWSFLESQMSFWSLLVPKSSGVLGVSSLIRRCIS